jgi:hypothetical protein
LTAKNGCFRPGQMRQQVFREERGREEAQADVNTLREQLQMAKENEQAPEVGRIHRHFKRGALPSLYNLP